MFPFLICLIESSQSSGGIHFTSDQFYIILKPINMHSIHHNSIIDEHFSKKYINNELRKTEYLNIYILLIALITNVLFKFAYNLELQ